MATLTIPDQKKSLANPAEISSYLGQRGIFYTQWEASVPFSKDASQDEILEAYQHALSPYMAKQGYQTADVISVHSETPNLAEIRAKFLREHTHSEDEVRFFVEGQGFFWFHLDDPEEPVFYVACTSGDLLSVPAGYKHWFDLGPDPAVKVIRIFTDASGWVPHYTESNIDARYQSVQYQSV